MVKHARRMNEDGLVGKYLFSGECFDVGKCMCHSEWKRKESKEKSIKNVMATICLPWSVMGWFLFVGNAISGNDPLFQF